MTVYVFEKGTNRCQNEIRYNDLSLSNIIGVFCTRELIGRCKVLIPQITKNVGNLQEEIERLLTPAKKEQSRKQLAKKVEKKIRKLEKLTDIESIKECLVDINIRGIKTEIDFLKSKQSEIDLMTWHQEVTSETIQKIKEILLEELAICDQTVKIETDKVQTLTHDDVIQSKALSLQDMLAMKKIIEQMPEDRFEQCLQ